MNKTLHKDIEVEIGKIKNCVFIPDDEGKRLIQKIVDIFSFNTRQRWMWENKNYAEWYDCSNIPWEPVLRKLLKKFNGFIFLVITGDEFFPGGFFI